MQQCKAVADQDVQLAEPLGRGPSSPPAVTRIALGVTAGETGEVVLSSRGRGTERVQCPSCQEPVAIWAAFCPHCGASLAAPAPEQPAERESLTSELFGSDDLRDTVERPRPEGAPDGESVAGESVAEEQYASEPYAEEPYTPEPYAAELIPTDPAPPAVAPTEALPVGTEPAPSTPALGAASAAGAGAAYGQGSPAGEPVWDDEPPRRSGATALLVAAGLVVALTLGFALWSIVRVSDTGDASSSPSAQTTTSPRGTPEGTSATPETSPPASPGQTPSTSPSKAAAGPVPAGAVACGVTGSGETAAVFGADQNTTCPFAQNVAAAYRATGMTDGGSVTVQATSPVTGKDYTLTCTGRLPTTCVADTGATVYLTNG